MNPKTMNPPHRKDRSPSGWFLAAFHPRALGALGLSALTIASGPAAPVEANRVAEK